jgi:hypothetical protein
MPPFDQLSSDRQAGGQDNADHGQVNCPSGQSSPKSPWWPTGRGGR